MVSEDMVDENNYIEMPDNKEMGEGAIKSAKGIIVPYDFPIIAVTPNNILKSKTGANCLESVLLNLCFAMKDRRKKTEAGYEIKFTSTELEFILGRKRSSGSFYTDLKDAAEAMVGRYIGIEDSVKKRFTFINIIPMAKFEKGELSVFINGGMPESILFNLTGNFTEVPVLPVLNFRNKGYTLRLYQFLLQACYGQHYIETKEGLLYVVQVGICESRFMLGNADIDAPEVRAVLKGIRNPTEDDYEKAYEVWEGKISGKKKQKNKILKKKKRYPNPNDYLRKAIDTAVKNINENDRACIKVECESVKVGRNHKTKYLIFKVTKLYNFKEIINESRQLLKEAVSESSEGVFCDENGQYVFETTFEFKNDGMTEAERAVNYLFGFFWPYRFIGNIELNEAAVRSKIKGFLKLTSNNVELIMEKYKLLQEQTDITDKFGWVAWALRNDFDGVTTIANRGTIGETVESVDFVDIPLDDNGESIEKISDEHDDGEKNDDEEELIPAPGNVIKHFMELLPDGTVKYTQINGDKTFEDIIPSAEEAREFCPLSDNMFGSCFRKFGMVKTENNYIDQDVFAERLGIDPDECEDEDWEFFMDVYMKAKQYNDIVEYAIREAEKSGLRYIVGNAKMIRTFKTFVKVKINEVFEYAFSHIE